MRRWLPSTCVALLAAALALPAVAGKNTTRGDHVWQAPDFAAFDVRSIALLPVATFDNNPDNRKLTEVAVGQALRGANYRWVSTLVTRDQVMRDGGDSLLKAMTQQVLKLGHLDSVDAPRFSRLTRARALLTVRVDRFERVELEREQSGKPSTTVQLTAALIDSTGRLLWTASGSETAEGPYQDPGTSMVGVKASGLTTTTLTNQGGAPTYPETLTRLLARWTPQFPVRPADAAH